MSRRPVPPPELHVRVGRLVIDAAVLGESGPRTEAFHGLLRSALVQHLDGMPANDSSTPQTTRSIVAHAVADAVTARQTPAIVHNRGR